MIRRALEIAATALAYTALVAAQASSLWLDIPFVKQSPEGCGAASIAMVMQYWLAQDGRETGRSAEATYIFDQLHSKEGRGIFAKQMEKYFQEQGFRTFVFSGTWDDLKQHLGKGRPLIVALKPTSASNVLHYVVVSGMDEQQGLVMFNDPAGRKLSKLDRKSFEEEWKATAEWTLLAVPQLPAR